MRAGYISLVPLALFALLSFSPLFASAVLVQDCNPMVPECPCGMVKGSSGQCDQQGENKNGCPCLDMTNKFPTPGVCSMAAPGNHCKGSGDQKKPEEGKPPEMPKMPEMPKGGGGGGDQSQPTSTSPTASSSSTDMSGLFGATSDLPGYGNPGSPGASNGQNQTLSDCLLDLSGLQQCIKNIFGTTSVSVIGSDNILTLLRALATTQGQSSWATLNPIVGTSGQSILPTSALGIPMWFGSNNDIADVNGLTPDEEHASRDNENGNGYSNDASSSQTQFERQQSEANLYPFSSTFNSPTSTPEEQHAGIIGSIRDSITGIIHAIAALVSH